MKQASINGFFGRGKAPKATPEAPGRAAAAPVQGTPQEAPRPSSPAHRTPCAAQPTPSGMPPPFSPSTSARPSPDMRDSSATRSTAKRKADACAAEEPRSDAAPVAECIDLTVGDNAGSAPTNDDVVVIDDSVPQVGTTATATPPTCRRQPCQMPCIYK